MVARSPPPCTGEFLRPAKFAARAQGLPRFATAAAAQSLERTWFVARAPLAPRLHVCARPIATAQRFLPCRVSCQKSAPFSRQRPRRRCRLHRPRHTKDRSPAASSPSRQSGREAGRSEGSAGAARPHAMDSRSSAKSTSSAAKASTGAHSPAKDGASATTAASYGQQGLQSDAAGGAASDSHAVAKPDAAGASPTALSSSGKGICGRRAGCSGHRRRRDRRPSSGRDRSNAANGGGDCP
jgi:hypothetical protein